MTIGVTPLSQHVGAEIGGVDARTADEGAATALMNALAAHGVVVLRDQHLTPPELVSFVRKFGEIDYAVREQFWLPKQPEIYVISNIVENGRQLGNPYDGFMWHSDLAYMQHPTAYTFLYGIEVPPEGADTEYCSTYRLYDELPQETRERFDGITVLHSHDLLHMNRPNAAPLTAEQRTRAPDVYHPLVRTHPISGRKGLYIGPKFSTILQGMTKAESDSILDDLNARAIDASHVYAHKWRVRDLVIWDNRGLMHTATEYDRARYRRLMHRVTVLGEKPF